MQRGPAGIALHAVGSLELGGPWYAMLCEPRRFRHALKAFWTECGFAGTHVVAAMPQEQLKVFTLEYSAAPSQSDAETIAAEAKEDVIAFLDLLDAAGLDVRALDIAGMALKRIVPWAGRRGAEDMQNALLIHVGAGRTPL